MENLEEKTEDVEEAVEEEKPDEGIDGNGTLKTGAEGKVDDGKPKGDLPSHLRNVIKDKDREIERLKASAGKPAVPEDVVEKVEKLYLRDQLQRVSPSLVGEADEIYAIQKRLGLTADDAVKMHLGAKLLESARNSDITPPAGISPTNPTATQDLTKLSDDKIADEARKQWEERHPTRRQ